MKAPKIIWKYIFPAFLLTLLLIVKPQNINLKPLLLQGKVVCNGKGIKDVSVTDGINICRTDANGTYKLQSTKQTPFVYFSSPSDMKPR
jgi:hypothetical protein